MADTANDIKVISRENAGFPEWLDFERMRREGMDYLGELAGKIWTDHNAHDPGITILENVCYALLDLGYRTSLPAADLFARDPQDNSPENNFLTPAQILGNNPLTILDYRRLLIDIEGVRNAWLTVAEDVTIDGICNRQLFKAPFAYSINQPIRVESSCKSFLNGLYHIYIELEEQIKTTEQKQNVVDIVKASVMAHRNLCEDFYDITVLCVQELGVCADIELRASADPAKVFIEMVKALQEFLSPAPKFYRLKDLTDKGRLIEDIFAGRPYDLAKSHGFIDTEEFEKIVLKKEIHISDIYNILFNIEGVAAVRNLSLRNCDGSVCDQRNPNGVIDQSKWIFKLYPNHVPRLDIKCSGFRFTRHGHDLLFDFRSAAGQIGTSLANSNKRVLDANSLDFPIPEGNYRKDIADYIPLENDFPKVYGITEGSLLSDVSDARKAQALQLKGYLLFFDVLLSGYLTQLKNLRQIFSFDGAGQNNDHTYFSNKLPETEGLRKLLSLDTVDTGTGSSLAFPVDKSALESIIKNGTIDYCDIGGKIPPYEFNCVSERDIAIRQLTEDFIAGNYTHYLLVSRKGCWVFYLVTTSERYVLLSRDQYKTEQGALAAIDAMQYQLVSAKSYRRYSNSNPDKHSFSIAAAQNNYWDYLQLLTENEQLYLERRNGFLDHLLSRFAETFTDYSLLSYSFEDATQVQQGNIKRKQDFLHTYPELSSTRGKAYNYQLNGWNNSNVSGFEKRMGAYAGMDSSGQENLCHFEVLEYEEQTMVNLAWQDKTLFSSEHSYESRDEGKAAVRSLLTAMQNTSNYQVGDEQYNKSEFGVRGANTVFRYPDKLSSDVAQLAVRQFSRMATPGAVKEDITTSQYRHDLTLESSKEQNRWNRQEPVITRSKELEMTPQLLSDFSDISKWKAEKSEDKPRPVKFSVNPDNPNEFIDSDGLIPYFNHVDIKGQSDIIKYTVRDESKSFFFISEEEFADEAVGENGLTRLFSALADASNYHVDDSKPEECYIEVKLQGRIIATNKIECESATRANEEIKRISDQFAARIYKLSVKTFDDLYQYTLQLGRPGAGNFLFASAKEYKIWDEAWAEAGRIASLPEEFSVVINKDHQLELKEKNEVLAIHRLEDPHADPKEQKKLADDLVKLKRVFNRISIDPKATETEQMIKPDPISAQGNFGYRLVKKDGYYAWFQLNGDFADKQKKTDKIKEVHLAFTNNVHLDICYGGNIIRERKDAGSNKPWYHFQVKSITGGVILFESTKGYDSAEEAQLAFNREYPGILTMAGIEPNYGTLINYEEIVAHNIDSCSDITASVYIPEETMRRFSYNHEAAKQQLSAIARSYPIRTIKKSDPLFHEYFPCADMAEDPVTGCCCGKDEKDYYYFVLPGKTQDQGQWISATWFNNPDDAIRAFHFFLVLLNYRGNYYINYKECDETCSWRLYLREILAVSSRRFKTAKDAWGEDGVQRFICISQTPKSFNPYQQADNCCYTFNVACGNMGLVHPCTYESADKRDRAMARLIHAATRWDEDFQTLRGPLWEEVTAKLEEIIIQANTGARNPCGSHQELVNIIKRSFNSSINKENDEALKRYESLSPEKKKAVLALANNFPVTRREGSNKYYVEIKFPGFCAESYEDDRKEKQHKKGKDGCNECCCTAWVSECCFETCKEALAYYYKVMRCLADRSNYLPVFDCECGPYGIKFFCHCEDHGNPDDPNNPDRDDDVLEVQSSSRNKECCNEIVAVNPNCYSYPKMACEAIERAKGLINAEGIHLIEHILLRPHCQPGFREPQGNIPEKDCQCLINTCNTIERCDFEWPIPGNDPCTMNGNDPLTYCFTPGTDPYSFIATAILPAWPQRFRKKENRALIEQMLYREMPSHIMLRVLWVSPADLCRFESLYRTWTKWMARKTICGDHNIPCDLIRFLFSKEIQTVENRRQETIWDCFTCNDCIPCDDTVTVPNPCNFEKEAGADPNAYVNSINRLYCWKEICLRPVTKRNLRLEDLSVISVNRTEEEKEMAERGIDSRFEKYRTEASKIAGLSGNTTAARVFSFLHESPPTNASYREIIERIIINDTDEDNRVLNHKEQSALSQLATWYYLDRSLLQGTMDQQLSELKDELAHLKENDLLPDYKSWHERELMKMQPGLKLTGIRKLFK